MTLRKTTVNESSLDGDAPQATLYSCYYTTCFVYVINDGLTLVAFNTLVVELNIIIVVVFLSSKAI